MNLALKTVHTAIPYDSPKILIVDDEARMCDSLEALLSGEGYEVQTSNSGKEATEHLAKNGFDLVLLDIVMREMDGLQVMHYVDSQAPDTLVILMTGHASVESAVEALRGGAHDYLRKPFEPEELLRTVRSALDQQTLKSEQKQAEERLQESTRRLQVAYDQSIIYAKQLTEEITERKRMEEKLLESEEKLRTQYKGMPIPTFTWQRVAEDFVLVDYNDAAKSITEGKIVNFLGHKVSEMFQDRPEVIEDCWSSFTEKKIINRESLFRLMTTGESKYLAVTYAPIPPDLILVHIEDIDDRKRAEEALRKAQDELERRVEERTAELVKANEQLSWQIEERKKVQEALWESEFKFRRLFENMTNSVAYHKVLFDEKHRPLDLVYVEVNEAFERVTGLKREEIIGKKVTEVIPGFKEVEPDLISIYAKVALTSESIRLDLYFEPFKRWYAISAYSPRKGYCAVVAEDITDRRRAEEQIRSLSHELLMAQESERQRISYELHDVVSQDLAALRIGLDTLFDNQPEAPPETRQRLSEFSKKLQETMATVRDLSRTLRSTGLDKRGLVSTVRLYCEEFSRRKRLKVDFFATGIDESRLDFNTKINLYRMIQEGLNNVKKHADANHVTIRLVESFPNIILRIEDDGKGFDVQDEPIPAANERRMGLRIMEERAALLQGKMKFETHPKQGTKIVVEVPYRDRKIGRKENHLNSLLSKKGFKVSNWKSN